MVNPMSWIGLRPQESIRKNEVCIYNNISRDKFNMNIIGSRSISVKYHGIRRARLLGDGEPFFSLTLQVIIHPKTDGNHPSEIYIGQKLAATVCGIMDIESEQLPDKMQGGTPDRNPIEEGALVVQLASCG